MRLRAAAIAITLTGCLAGNGSSLDELGVPVRHPDYPALATFEGADFPPTRDGVQQFFFNSFCTECHGNGHAPKDLALTSGDSFRNLLDMPAVERPDLMRVRVGDPDGSYLILKLEGADGIVGRQMPRRGPARPQSEIDVLRAWIENGCP